jgi:GTPase SAR1 family protein
MLIPNLLLIAGTGAKAGKTTLACRIIRQRPELRITAIKITPHFHETTHGLIVISECKGYSIYEETEKNSTKDTSRMLDSGADRVFFAKVWDNNLQEAFNEIMKLIPEGSPVICESPALRDFTEPGVFIIITSVSVNKQKKLNYLQDSHHLLLKLEELDNIESVPIEFNAGIWKYKS